MTRNQGRSQDRMVVDRQILVGKPVVRGTRIGVAQVLQQLAATLDPTALFAAYPELTLADVRACLSYAQTLVEAADLAPVPHRSQG